MNLKLKWLAISFSGFMGPNTYHNQRKQPGQVEVVAGADVAPIGFEHISIDSYNKCNSYNTNQT